MSLYKKWQAAYKCAAGFLVQGPEDAFWKTCTKDGVAKLFGICQPYGYGLVKVEFPIEKMATLVAHELGHEFGFSHDDDEIDEPYRLMSEDPIFKDYVTGIMENCGSENDIGCDDPTGVCIMDPNPTKEYPKNRIRGKVYPYPSKYSKCSMAYLDFVINFPFIYDTTCLNK